MSQIPAPLLNRQTAIAVVVFSLLGVAAAVATLVIPIDGSVLWLVVVRQVVLAVQVAVVALAVLLIWRTAAGRSFATTIASLAAIGGLLLFALVQVATIVVATAWGVRPMVIALELVALLAAVLMIGGLLGLGVSVLRHRGWRGPTRVTPIVMAVLVIPLIAAQALHLPLAIPYALWSLSFLGLAVGLRRPRVVPVSGVPDTQLGAAQVRSVAG
jgi:hypothetical protein